MMAPTRHRLGALAGMILLLTASTALADRRSTSVEYSPRVAVLRLGDVTTLRDEITRVLAAAGATIVSSGIADSAASGVGYDGSLNPTRDEARRLTSAIGCEILVIGTSSVVERESGDAGHRWDAFAGIFLVDGRSGRLVHYRGFSVFADVRTKAEQGLVVAAATEVRKWTSDLDSSRDAVEQSVMPDEASYLDLVAQPEASKGVIPPRFFARPVPGYTADADRAHATATVELIVEFLADGSYGRIVVDRWGGFGLDESAIEAVRSSRFWPARLNDTMVPCRAMLRFNFRFRSEP